MERSFVFLGNIMPILAKKEKNYLKGSDTIVDNKIYV